MIQFLFWNYNNIKEKNGIQYFIFIIQLIRHERGVKPIEKKCSQHNIQKNNVYLMVN